MARMRFSRHYRGVYIVTETLADRGDGFLHAAFPAACFMRIRIEQAELACARLQPADANPDEPHRAATLPHLI